MDESKTITAIRLAHFKGYRVVNGKVISPHGKIRICQTKGRSNFRTPYLQFTIGIGNKKTTQVCVHRLVAFQKFGEASFGSEIQVRHLDDNSLNNLDHNIGIGTRLDNAMDQSPEKRSARGHCKHTQDLLERVKQDHDNGLSYKKLRKKYGLSLSLLSYYLSKNAKSRVSDFNPRIKNFNLMGVNGYRLNC